MQAEGEVVEIAVLEPSPKRKRPLLVTQKVYQCHHCEFSSISASSVSNHLKTHGRDLEHKCSLCNFSSSQKQKLVNHLENQHFLPIRPSSQVFIIYFYFYSLINQVKNFFFRRIQLGTMCTPN